MAKHELGWEDSRVQMIDLQYHDIRPGKGLYAKLEEAEAVERIVTDDEISKAIYDPPQGHARVLPRHVPAALRGRDRVGELGLGDLRPQGGTPEEDLHARAAPRHRGARPPAPHRVPDRGGLAPQHLPIERRDVTGMMDQGNPGRGGFNDYSNPSFM